MRRLSLRLHPDPSLSRPCDPVQEFGQELEQLAAEMGQAMRDHGGVGLAANQVGLNLRLLVIAGELCGGSGILAMANPSLEHIRGECELEEGCLSLPGVRQRLPGRAHWVRVGYQDMAGVERRMELEGLGALCLQHEMDHLNGLTMLDRMSALKASRAKAKLAKLRKGAS